MAHCRPVVVLFLLLAAWPVLARQAQKPNFSGEWTFTKEKSRLQGARFAGLERGVFRINHKEPIFSLERTFTIQGKDSKASFTLTTDGKVVEGGNGEITQWSRMYWEADILVLSQRFEHKQFGEATNVVHYRLLDGGRVLQASERLTGPDAHENLWIFEKASSPGT
jgi:hypothetical protein